MKEIEQVEDAYQKYGVDSFTFNAKSYALKKMIRDYCNEKGIQEVKEEER